MQTFKQFLSENTTTALSYDRIKKLIKRDCSEFINMNTPPIYRGTDNNPDYFYSIPRIDRKPTTTDRELHDYLNIAFAEVFGFAARSESVFVTGDISQASSYGKSYFIFPKDGFTGLWSREIHDLYTSVYVDYPPASGTFEFINAVSGILEDNNVFDSEEIDLYDIYQYHELMVKLREENNPLYKKAMIAGLDAFVEDQYVDTDFEMGIKSGNEIMLKCDGFYAISTDYERYSDIVDGIKGE